MAGRARAGGDGRPAAAYGASKPGRVVGCSDWTLVMTMMMAVVFAVLLAQRRIIKNVDDIFQYPS